MRISKLLITILKISAIMSLALASAYYVLIFKKIEIFDREIQPAVKTVLLSIHKNEISGGYWENDMLSQFKYSISQLADAKRFGYYLAMITYTDLDTSRATLFIEMVGDDVISFSEYLSGIEESEIYSNFDESERQSIALWSSEMKMLSSLKLAEKEQYDS